MATAQGRTFLVLIGAILALLALAGPALAQILPPTILAQDADDGEEESEDSDEDGADASEETGEAFRGELLDGDGEPVAGVTIRVETEDGEPVGEVETSEDGTWLIPLPGPGSYSVTLDQETLPGDVALQDPERDTLTPTVRTGAVMTMRFQTGEAAEVATFADRFLNRAIAGVRFGLIIAITAIGLSLIFGTTGLVNFAHGELVTFGAIVAWFLNAPAGSGAGLHLLIAGAIAIVVSAGLGGTLELGLWRPLRRRKAGLIQMLVISIGLALLLRNLLQLWYGGSSRPYFDYTISRAMDLGPITISPRDLSVMAASTVVLVAVATMLQRTKMGKAMRAVSDNRDLAESSGIDVQRVILVIWVMGGGLAGFGGLLYGITENVSYLMGFRLLLLMFAGVILGGLGTAYGAMVGSIVVGLVTELSTLWFSTELKFVWALGVLILILLVRPQGLLGRAERIG